MDHFRDLYSPHIGPRIAKDEDYFKVSIDQEMNRLLEAYESERPQLADGTRTEIRRILEQSGLEAKYFDQMESK